MNNNDALRKLLVEAIEKIDKNEMDSNNMLVGIFSTYAARTGECLGCICAATMFLSIERNGIVVNCSYTNREFGMVNYSLWGRNQILFESEMEKQQKNKLSLVNGGKNESSNGRNNSKGKRSPKNSKRK
jgi:hypothetical protein